MNQIPFQDYHSWAEIKRKICDLKTKNKKTFLLAYSDYWYQGSLDSLDTVSRSMEKVDQ